MSKVKIQGNASGTGVLTVTAPNTSTDRTITLPDSTGTLLDSTSTLDATKLSGDLPAISGASLTNLPAASQLDHSGTKKFEATASGVTLTGTTGTSPILELNNADTEDNDTGRESSLRYTGKRSGGEDVVNAQISGHHDGSADDDKGMMLFYTNNGSGLSQQLKITNDGRGLSQFTARGWVHFNGNGTVSIADSHNVSSITDSSNGHFEINWSNNMANTNYSVACTSGHIETENQTDSYTATSFRHQGILTNKVEIQCIRLHFGTQQMGDPYIVCAVAFGD